MVNPNIELELKIQHKINEYIDSFESFRFNAGAGAGKTFALIESIKHILNTKLQCLQNNSQHVVCITYTNVAVKEIRARLGLSETVLISTIHERLWELIKQYQPELIVIHSEKLMSELATLNDELMTSNKFQRYIELGEPQRIEFDAFVLSNKDLFYSHIESGATLFRTALTSVENSPAFLSAILQNVANFRDLVKKIYKRDKYSDCLKRISEGLETRLKYDSRTNSDRLEYMRFSHDTLLEYGLKLIEKFPTLRRVIIDKYPYFLIDEYQDTNPQVVGLIKNLVTYANSKEKSFLVGYFGDTAQNIYEDGVGSKIESFHPEFKNVDKPFNRRSHEQIVNVINKIRADNIQQVPIFSERNQGGVGFYYSISSTDSDKLSTVKDFITEYQTDLSEARIDCLVLTNKMMAQLNGFGEAYSTISESESIYWKDLNTKFLSQDLEKLDSRILLIYNLIIFYKTINYDSATYSDLFGKLNKRITFIEAMKAVSTLRGVEVRSLKDLLNGLDSLLCNADINATLKESLLDRLALRESRLGRAPNDFKRFVLAELHELMHRNNSVGGEMVEGISESVNNILEVGISEWELWADFISKKEGENLVFHTYHGTKGEEYENVAIIMEHSFGLQGRDKFKNYFKHLQLGIEEQNILLENVDYQHTFENTKNLIYVACSRAIKNLRILYLDDVNDIRTGIEHLFSNINVWDVDGTT